MCVSYRPQLWHIPAKVIRSMHHLSNDAIHLLHQQKTRTDIQSKHWGDTVIYFVLTITILVQLLTELSRTPLPSLSYSLKATEKNEKKWWMNDPSYRGVTEYCSVLLQQRGTQSGLTLQLVSRLAILQKREVTRNVLEKDLFYERGCWDQYASSIHTCHVVSFDTVDI